MEDFPQRTILKRRHQHVHVVRHDTPGVKAIPLALKVQQRVLDEAGHSRQAEQRYHRHSRGFRHSRHVVRIRNDCGVEVALHVGPV